MADNNGKNNKNGKSNSAQDDADAKFTAAVREFADAFFALSEEERAELAGYTQRRMLEAQSEYIKSVDKVPDDVINSVIEQFKQNRSQDNFNETFMYALNGYVKCEEQVAYSYFKGLGVRKDYAEAFKWFKKAAEHGSAKAQFAVGSCYENGTGANKNNAEAFKWYKSSADQGFALAQYNVGYCYQQGLGVQKNEAEAVNWYKKAAEQGNAKGQSAYGSLLLLKADEANDDNLAHDAAVWLRKAADQGDAHAQCGLGMICEFGIGQEANTENAIYWYKKAADNGDKKARERLQHLQGN